MDLFLWPTLLRQPGFKPSLSLRPWTCIGMIIIPPKNFTTFLFKNISYSLVEYWQKMKPYALCIRKVVVHLHIITYNRRPFIVSFVLVMRYMRGWSALFCYRIYRYLNICGLRTLWYICKSGWMCGWWRGGSWACLYFSRVAKSGLSGSEGPARPICTNSYGFINLLIAYWAFLQLLPFDCQCCNVAGP